MLTDIIYSFNKQDYFKYLCISIIVFIFLNNLAIVNIANILPLVFTGIVIYFIMNKQILDDFSKMQTINNKLIRVNIDKYKYLAQESSVIDTLFSLMNLANFNRVKFDSFIKTVDNFFYLYTISSNKNLNPTHIYNLAKDQSKEALNNLTSFYIDLNAYPVLDKDQTISTGGLETENVNIQAGIDEFKNIFSKYLNEMEYNVNKKWLKGDINIYSSPIYPDEVGPSVLSDVMYSNRYTIY